MKRIKHILLATILLAVAGCDDSYLDMTNKFGSNTDTFYRTKSDFDAAIGGVYNSLYISGGNVFAEEHISASLLDDTMLGGGGPDDQQPKEGLTRDLISTEHQSANTRRLSIHREPGSLSGGPYGSRFPIFVRALGSTR